MNPFHYPPASLEARFPFDDLDLFATATNVGGEAELLYGSTHFIKVITFIQAQTLRLLPGERRSYPLECCPPWPKPASYRGD